MEANQTQADSVSANSQVFTFGSELKMSRHNPIDIKPQLSQRWLTNGLKNSIYKRYINAYDDSPTNKSIIDSYINYIFGDGLIDLNSAHKTEEELTVNQMLIAKYVSEDDAMLMVADYKKFGGFACQIIYSYAKVPLRIEYIPIYKLAVGFVPGTAEVNGYWFSWDWNNIFRYIPQFYPLFTGKYTEEQNLEILVIKRATSEPFFPVPDYFAGIPWAEAEGDLANGARSHFENVFGALTVINYNSGKMATPELARIEAEKVRDKYCGTNAQAKVIVSFNEGPETAVTVDQMSPPELNQQNVFYSEEAERKLIVAHSAPPILFRGSNQGSGFSSNAEEIAIQTKVLYRRQINPARKTICNGLMKIFKMIPDCEINLGFIDFEEADELDKVQ